MAVHSEPGVSRMTHAHLQFTGPPLLGGGRRSGAATAPPGPPCPPRRQSIPGGAGDGAPIPNADSEKLCIPQVIKHLTRLPHKQPFVRFFFFSMLICLI